MSWLQSWVTTSATHPPSYSLARAGVEGPGSRGFGASWHCLDRLLESPSPTTGTSPLAPSAPREPAVQCRVAAESQTSHWTLAGVLPPSLAASVRLLCLGVPAVTVHTLLRLPHAHTGAHPPEPPGGGLSGGAQKYTSSHVGTEEPGFPGLRAPLTAKSRAGGQSVQLTCGRERSAGAAGPRGPHVAQPLDTSPLGAGAVGHADGPCVSRGLPLQNQIDQGGEQTPKAPSPILQKRKLRLRGYGALSKVSEVGSDRNDEPREPERGDTTGQLGAGEAE